MTEHADQPLRKLQRSSPLRELAYERIRRELLPGGVLHGVDRLVERDLADRLAMSRTPVRDALRRLELAGIVEPLAGGGYARRRVTLREVEELHELLLLLEPVAARMAAEAEPRTRQELLDSSAIVTRDASPLANTRFHVALAESSGNVVLARVVANLNERLAIEQQLFEPSEATTGVRLAEGHDAIVEAVRRADAEGSAAAMRRHLELGRDVLSQHLRNGRTTHV